MTILTSDKLDFNTRILLEIKRTFLMIQCSNLKKNNKKTKKKPGQIDMCVPKNRCSTYIKQILVKLKGKKRNTKYS